jgi:hypothetical protein
LGSAVLAACGGGAAAVQDTPTTIARPTTMSATPPTTTTLPPTTMPAPTTTVEDVKAKVIADFNSTVRAYETCLSEPSDCDVSTIASPGSQSEANLTSWFSSLASGGVRGRPNPHIDSRVVESVEIASDGHTASLTSCMVDGAILYRPSAAGDAVVDDRVISTRTIWSMTLIGSTWKRSSAKVLIEKPGSELCQHG